MRPRGEHRLPSRIFHNHLCIPLAVLLAGQSGTAFWAGLPSLGDCPAEGAGDGVVGGRRRGPSQLRQLGLLHNCAGHCQGAGVALPRRSLCGSRGWGESGGGRGSGQAGQASDPQPGSLPTIAIHSRGTLGDSRNSFTCLENPFSSCVRALGTGQGQLLWPQPGSARGLCGKPSFGPPSLLTPCALALAKVTAAVPSTGPVPSSAPLCQSGPLGWFAGHGQHAGHLLRGSS